MAKTIEESAADFEASNVRAQKASQQLHDFANLDATQTVTTDSGTIPTLAKFVADKGAEVDAALTDFQVEISAAIADDTDPAKGAGLVGYKAENTYAPGTAGRALNIAKLLHEMNGYTDRGPWVTGTQYWDGEFYTFVDTVYFVDVPHVATTVEGDLAAELTSIRRDLPIRAVIPTTNVGPIYVAGQGSMEWHGILGEYVALSAPASAIVVTPSGGVTATNVQEALENIDALIKPVDGKVVISTVGGVPVEVDAAGKLTATALNSEGIQLGSNADPAKSFVIRTPEVEDGTLEIRKGTIEAPGPVVAKFDGDGLVDPRTFQNMFGLRPTDTDFTNNTGMVIHVYISGVNQTGTPLVNGFVNGFVVASAAYSTTGVSIGINFAVPPNGTYKVAINAFAITQWYEYRKGP